MARDEWDSDCCENCKYYSLFTCNHEFSDYYEESVDEDDCCCYHSKVDSIY